MTLITNSNLTALPASRRLTYRQFLTDPTVAVHSEWVDGDIIPMAPISNEHQFIGVFLLNLINTFVTHHQLGFVLNEPFQMKTGPKLPGRSPDILFLAKANEKRLKKNHIEGPADLVIEIISPESRSRDRVQKFAEYEKGGVREYWLIDPPRKQAEFYIRSSDSPFTLATLSKVGVFCSYAVKGLWIKTAWLFQVPLPSPSPIFKLWKLS